MRKLRYMSAAALAAAGLTAAMVPAQAGTTKVVKRSVEVGDYYFAPAKMTVRKGTYVYWKWPKAGGDGHDVVLVKGPRGVKKFASDVFFADETYRRRLRVPGTYRIICSLHEDQMKQTIVVKR